MIHAVAATKAADLDRSHKSTVMLNVWPQVQALALAFKKPEVPTLTIKQLSAATESQ